ncbi:conserved hypothetical protein [Shewanella denitrificans OS217]|uniref:Uncharacterized protein n=2 Tax=Shewanella TaxID=22 RepID=Q12JW9_SHEDO|nr:conserved hypothetical protein [Shewanella denitrificans OS217]
MPTQDVFWPAILKLEQTKELIYLESKSDWIAYACLNSQMMDPLDRLIDLQGWIFNIKDANQFTMQSGEQGQEQVVKQLPSLVATEQQMTALQLIPLVRQYAEFLEQCCSAKLVFNSISQGIALVASLEQNS